MTHVFPVKCPMCTGDADDDDIFDSVRSSPMRGALPPPSRSDNQVRYTHFPHLSSEKLRCGVPILTKKETSDRAVGWRFKARYYFTFIIIHRSLKGTCLLK